MAAETSATIIDLCAYRARKRNMLESPRSAPRKPVPDIAPSGVFFFWPVIAWMPLGLLLAPAAVEDFA